MSSNLRVRKSLLCDLMTQRGSLMAISRHGIDRTDTGALVRSSFEETVEIPMEVVAAGERDNCHGIAENVMFGRLLWVQGPVGLTPLIGGPVSFPPTSISIQ